MYDEFHFSRFGTLMTLIILILADVDLQKSSFGNFVVLLFVCSDLFRRAIHSDILYQEIHSLIH